MPTKFMCPFGPLRHVVPIIGNSEIIIRKHIEACHDKTKRHDPIPIHARQINFAFSMPHITSARRTTAAELFFETERKKIQEIAENLNTETSIPPNLEWLDKDEVLKDSYYRKVYAEILEEITDPVVGHVQKKIKKK